jgi:ribosomal protein S18 acetylase RimI-like enzyme
MLLGYAWDNSPEMRPLIWCMQKSKQAIETWLKQTNTNAATVFYIYGLAVRKAYRHKGIGTKLATEQLQLLKEVAKETGSKYAIVETSGNNSRKIFQKLGKEINFISYKTMMDELKCPNEIFPDAYISQKHYHHVV